MYLEIEGPAPWRRTLAMQWSSIWCTKSPTTNARNWTLTM